MTVHNEANYNDIAKTVIMPGDPKRAEVISKYLTNVKKVNSIRNMDAYTGFYKNHRITVMASGMGIPSIGIYSYELYKFYDVENIIRVGSTGALDSKLNLYDIIVVESAYSNSTYANNFNDNNNIFYADNMLLSKIKKTALNLNKNIKIGRCYSSDTFYADTNIKDIYENKKCIVQEMETFALFFNAKYLNKKAATILTVSDNIVTKETTTPLQRQNTFDDMILLALETSINL